MLKNIIKQILLADSSVTTIILYGSKVKNLNNNSDWDLVILGDVKNKEKINNHLKSIYPKEKFDLFIETNTNFKNHLGLKDFADQILATGKIIYNNGKQFI